MFNLDYTANENSNCPGKKLPYIPDHPYRMLVSGGSRSRKTNA